jgi:hypothetical protein
MLPVSNFADPGSAKHAVEPSAQNPGGSWFRETRAGEGTARRVVSERDQASIGPITANTSPKMIAAMPITTRTTPTVTAEEPE